MVIRQLPGRGLSSQIGHGDGRTAAIILGSLAGAAIGVSGHSMAETDRLKEPHKRAKRSERASASSWRSPDGGNQYMVTPALPMTPRRTMPGTTALTPSLRARQVIWHRLRQPDDAQLAGKP